MVRSSGDTTAAAAGGDGANEAGDSGAGDDIGYSVSVNIYRADPSLALLLPSLFTTLVPKLLPLLQQATEKTKEETCNEGEGASNAVIEGQTMLAAAYTWRLLFHCVPYLAADASDAANGKNTANNSASTAIEFLQHAIVKSRYDVVDTDIENDADDADETQIPATSENHNLLPGLKTALAHAAVVVQQASASASVTAAARAKDVEGRSSSSSSSSDVWCVLGARSGSKKENSKVVQTIAGALISGSIAKAEAEDETEGVAEGVTAVLERAVLVADTIKRAPSWARVQLLADLVEEGASSLVGPANAIALLSKLAACGG